MRRLLAVVAVFGLVAQGACNAKPEPKRQPLAQERPTPTLKPGDPAPSFHADRWLQGRPVNVFDAGKTYVVEFWATWCGPCIVMMPHLAELQARYRGQGVTIIGYSVRDPNNNEAQVADFVAKRGAKLGYTFAYSDGSETYQAWMGAAGQRGIPCSFVVDGIGRIAYIGHPMHLGHVLPLVLKGEPVAAISAAVDRVERDTQAISNALGGADPRAGLKALASYRQKYPEMANLAAWTQAEMTLLPRLGDIAGAKAAAQRAIKRATEQGDPAVLQMIRGVLRTGPGKEDRELQAVALQAAEAAVQVTDGTDAVALINLAGAYLDLGEKAKAREQARKARAAAATASPRVKNAVEEQARLIEEVHPEDGA